jgi:branched-chain amino acid transport system permease protein
VAAWWASNETLVRQICIFMIAAASLQITLNAGVFSLLNGATWLIGGYTAAIVLREGGNTLVAFAAAILLGAAISYGLSLATARLSGTALAMATISLVLIVGVSIRSMGDFTGGALGLYGIPVRVTTEGAILAAAIVAVVLFAIESGRTGRAISALREDSHVAASVGIPVRRVRHLLMLLSGALAALSGALYSLSSYALAPTQGGFDFILLLLSMVIIGGVGSWVGAYLGAALLTWLPDVSSLADKWNGVLYGVLLIVIVVYAPGGVTGLVRSAFNLVRRLALRAAPRPAAQAPGDA